MRSGLASLRSSTRVASWTSRPLTCRSPGSPRSRATWRLPEASPERAHAYAEAQGGNVDRSRGSGVARDVFHQWAGEPLRALERFEVYAEQAAAAGFSTSIAIHIADHVEALLEVRRSAGRTGSELELWEADARKLGHHRAPAEIARCRGLVAATDSEVDRAIELLEEAVSTMKRSAIASAGPGRCSSRARGAGRGRNWRRARRSRPRWRDSRRSAPWPGWRRRGPSSAASAVARARTG